MGIRRKSLSGMLKLLKEIREFIVENLSFRDILGGKENFIVAVDFDGTICVDKYPEAGELIEGVVEGLGRIKELGGKIVIFSGRTGQAGELAQKITDRDVVKEMVEFLHKYKVPYDNIWFERGKPIHDFLIDDRSVPPFDGDWKKAVDYIEKEVNDKNFVSVLDVVRFD